MTPKTYIVGYETAPHEWHFAGIYTVDLPDPADPTDRFAMLATERERAENAAKQAALDIEESDKFGVIATDLIEEVQIAYRKRVVGIARPAPPSPPQPV